MATPDKDPEPMNEPVMPAPTPGEVNLDNANIDSVHGEKINISDSSVHHVDAEQVNMNESSAQVVESNSISANESMIGQAHAETLSLTGGNVGLVYTRDAVVSGNAGAVIAQTTTLNECRTGFLVAREVHGGRIHSAVMLAGRVDGPIETVVDARKALIIGAVAGIVMGVIVGFFKLFIQRNS